MTNKIKKSKPILFATLGFPGSGKTYFAMRFAKDFGVFHLNSDRIRAEIFLKPKYTLQENKAVFRIMNLIAEELLMRGISVIYDANSTKRIYRKRLELMAKRQKAKYLLLWFQTPVGIALKRIRVRKELKSKLMRIYNKSIGDWVLFRIKKSIEEPKKEPHVIINGERPYKEQRKEVFKFLNKI